MQLPIPGELVCQVSLLNLNNPRALSELRYQNSFMWKKKKKQELDVELLMSNFPFTSLHPRDARYVLSSSGSRTNQCLLIKHQLMMVLHLCITGMFDYLCASRQKLDSSLQEGMRFFYYSPACQ